MKKFKKVLVLIPLFFISLALLLYIIITYSPKTTVSITSLSFNILPLMLFLTALVFFCFVGFMYRNYRRGLFAGLFVLSFLLLRYFGYTNFFFLLLLLAIFLLLELFFIKQSDEPEKQVLTRRKHKLVKKF